MAYEHNLPKAANRHREAADELEKGSRRDVAGYLYGIAAECAVKQMALRLPMPAGKSRNEIFYEHFPNLRTLLRESLQGRSGLPLLRIVENDSFMNRWDITMRYADAAQIRAEWIDSWRDQARAVVNAMEA